MMESTRLNLSRYRQRIVDDAVKTFMVAAYFQGKGRPAADIVMAVSEGLLDLMEEGASQDYKTVKMYMEWLYNLIRKEGKKIDTTLDFLDRFEAIVARYLTNEEDVDLDKFFELCRDIIRENHEALLR